MKYNHKFIKIGFTRSYLINCNDGYLLIDTGYPNDYEKFILKLKKKYNININDIKALLLTHHHDDHAGFAAKLLKNSGATLIVHENALENLKLGVTEIDSIPLNRRIKLIFGFFNRFHKFEYPPLIPNEEDIIIRGLHDNKDILNNLGVNGLIIHTPGHTNDGISIVLTDGSVFPGDNTMNAWYFNIFGIKKRPIFVQDLNLIFESWERYIKLGGKMLYPAHGKAFNIKKILKKLNKLKKK
ncbi:MAG: MBL fold metallo-hydrolase [Candidatus Odinarchaeota archaeon]